MGYVEDLRRLVGTRPLIFPELLLLFSMIRMKSYFNKENSLEVLGQFLVGLWNWEKLRKKQRKGKF